MSVYMIAEMTIHDRAEYGKYEDKFMAVFEQFKGKMLSVDDNPKCIEGEWTASRSVLIEFPTKQDLYAWLTSDAYQEISKHRVAASTAKAIMVQGGNDLAK